jgi:DNA-directed RNA polymerase specialized sigma24 family protein
MTTSLTGQAQAALYRLHRQARRAADNFDLERIDRALDRIVHLNSPEPHERQVRSAMGSTLKVMRRRREIAPCQSLDALGVDQGISDPEQEVIDLRLWLRETKRITEQQRRLLILLAGDLDAETIAAMYRIPVPRMRERIARARKAARMAYSSDMSAA